MRGWGKQAIEDLRGAVYRGDGTSVVELLRGDLPRDLLQMAGDGLLIAVAHDVPEAADRAAQCETALRERDWDGDAELADQLAASLNRGATPMLRALPVELDDLAALLEGDPTQGGGRIDLTTGECWPEFVDDAAAGLDEDEDEDEDRWLYVHCEGSHDGYRDMERFIGTIDDATIVDRLEIAIQGRGAFRRFKDVLSRWPDELQRYFQFCEERQRGRARAWLAAEGYRPVPAPRS